MATNREIASELRKLIGVTEEEASDGEVLQVCKGSLLKVRVEIGLAIKDVIHKLTEAWKKVYDVK